MVHLPDVRLRASDFRCPGIRDAFDVQPGIRRSSAAVRLGARSIRVAVEAGADRIRAAQYRIHRDEQTEACLACKRRPCAKLGRSTHADTERLPQTRLYT